MRKIWSHLPVLFGAHSPVPAQTVPEELATPLGKSVCGRQTPALVTPAMLDIATARPSTRTFVPIQLALLLLAAAVLIPAVTPREAVNGGPWLKLLFVARIAVLVAFAHWMLRKRSLSWSDVGLRRPDWKRFLIALASGAIMTFAINALAHTFLTALRLPTPDYSMFAPIKRNLGEYLFWMLPVTLGTAAFGEELIFRGFITDALRRLCGGSGAFVLVTAIVAQAVIFGALHFYQGIGGVVAAAATGVALGLTWLIAGRNLWAGIVLHALLDGSAMTAIYLGYVTTR